MKVAQALTASLFGGTPPAGKLAAPVPHIFTHRKVTYYPVHFVLSGEGVLPHAPPGMQWVDLEALDQVPIPRAQQRILGGAQTLSSA
jgi:hypothetical protein